MVLGPKWITIKATKSSSFHSADDDSVSEALLGAQAGQNMYVTLCVCVCAMCHVCAQNPVEKTVATRACLAAASGKSIVATLARHATSGQILYKLVTAGCKKTATSGQIPYRLVTASCKTKTAFFKLSSMWPYAFFYPSHCLSHHSTQFSASFNAAGCKSQGLQDMQITACTP